jgi:hypothetical protein
MHLITFALDGKMYEMHDMKDEFLNFLRENDVCGEATHTAVGGQTLYLLYVWTSFLWWQGVAGTIGVKSSNALRMNWRCTGRHTEGLRNGQNTAINSTLSPSRMCGSVKAGVPC